MSPTYSAIAMFSVAPLLHIAQQNILHRDIINFDFGIYEKSRKRFFCKQACRLLFFEFPTAFNKTRRHSHYGLTSKERIWLHQNLRPCVSGNQFASGFCRQHLATVELCKIFNCPHFCQGSNTDGRLGRRRFSHGQKLQPSTHGLHRGMHRSTKPRNDWDCPAVFFMCEVYWKRRRRCRNMSG